MTIPYGRQAINQEDIDAVVQVLQSDFITQGPVIPKFEQAVAQICKAEYCLAVNSATSALHLACLALGLRTGGRVWTSPITFVASANCALYCQAQVDFIDIDRNTGNLCPIALHQKLQQAAVEHTLPDIVIVVHFAGQPCNMQAIKALADEYQFAIIEDASHAIGAIYQLQPVGGCQYSDITVFSFHPVKIITTGEGGMLTTQSEKLFHTALHLRSHGITRDSSEMTESSHGPWYYQQLALGYNYRMTDIHAALGYSQLQRLSSFIEKRTLLAERYIKKLTHLPLKPLVQSQSSQSAWHLFIVQLDPHLIEHKQRIFMALQDAGVGVNVHYIPVHIQPYYQQLGFHADDFPAALAYYRAALTLPLFPSLTEQQQDYICQTLSDVLSV